MNLLKKLFITAILLLHVMNARGEETIVFWDRMQDNPIIYQILKLALDKTVTDFGAYRLMPSMTMEQKRVIFQLQQNNSIHIANFAPDKIRESQLLPIRIPVTQGLLGYRVCLIKKGTQSKFDAIKNLKDWQNKGITIGQGKDWPDTKILQANQIPVIKSSKYTPLFNMLNQGRFDCFSRSISEVTAEIEKYNYLELMLEKNLLLVYRLPTFFFVSQQNPELAARLKRGMQIAYEDGSIQTLIKTHYQSLFAPMNISKRIFISLENPFLSPATQNALKSFNHWFELSEF